MKRILIFCLLGIAVLFNDKASAEKAKAFSRIVDINKDGWILYITSQTEDGQLTRVDVYETSGYTLVLQKYCSGYDCEVDCSELDAGTYQAKAFTQYAPVYSEYFTLN